MGSPNQIVLATHNKDKTAEFQSIFSGLEVEVVSLDGFPSVGQIEEDGETLEENALKKAREVFRQTGIPSLADDTGLEVFYLDYAPGVYSARYAGPGATYRDNVAKLLADLRGVPPRRRGAQFRCVLALVGWDSRDLQTEGVCQGQIIEEPRGQNGFGYDPIFVPSGLNQTYAELDPSMKNSLSHRGRAAKEMVELIHRKSGVTVPSV